MSTATPSAETLRRIALAKPSFDASEEAAVLETIRSGWVTQGPKVAHFERSFAEVVGAREAIATSSCSTALFLSLHALGIGRGDEVIVPSLSFIASANVILQTGAAPVFADVDPRSYNLDPRAAEAAITPRTRAILPVHQLGLPAELERFAALARSRGLALVEDAACAVGAQQDGRPIGSSGNLVCFSFHPRKVLVTGEGGMITTNDAALAERLRRLRHHGMSISDVERHRAAFLVRESYDEVGFNLRLSDVHAALGLAQLAKLPRLLARRRAVAARYATSLAGETAVVLPHVPDGAQPNYQSYIVRLRGEVAGQRNRVMDGLLRRGVATRRGLMASHLEAAHRDTLRAGPLPHTEAAARETLLLPCHAELSDDDIDYVVTSLREALVEAAASAGQGVRSGDDAARPGAPR